MKIFSLELNTNTQINLETSSRIKYTVATFVKKILFISRVIYDLFDTPA